MCWPCICPSVSCFPSIHTATPPSTPPTTPEFKPANGRIEMRKQNKLLATQIALDRLAEQQIKQNKENA